MHVLVLHKKMLSLRDDRAYRELYGLVIETLLPPDLLVYLQASVPTLMERIGHDIRMQTISERILDKLQGEEEAVFPEM